MTHSADLVKLNRFLDIVKTINSELDLNKQLELIMDAIIEISRAERGFLILLSDNSEPTVAVARNMDREEVQRANAKISSTILRNVLASEKPIVLADAMGDSEFSSAKSIQQQKARSVCAFPLKSDKGVIGAVYLDNRFQQGIFSEDDLAMLNAFSSQVAVAIANAKLFEKRGVELQEAREEVEHSRTELSNRYRQTNIIGRSPAIREVFKAIDKVINVNFPVLIYGESGTGKELVAKAIHYNGSRKSKPFYAANCGSIPDSLIESELFGYKRGAFTGADRDKKGLFELADGGTLLLDEIGNMSKQMQESLLRVLQEGEIMSIGGKNTVKVDVRIISASNDDLLQLIDEGTFRQDLYFRINVITINLPPLRERKDDIPLLVEHILSKITEETKIPKKKVTKKVLTLLMEYNWHGNIRELENVLRQAATLSDGDILDDRLSTILSGRKVALNKNSDEILSIDEYVRGIFEQYGPKMKYEDIANKLGVSRKTLWEMKRKWGLTKS